MVGHIANNRCGEKETDNIRNSVVGAVYQNNS